MNNNFMFNIALYSTKTTATTKNTLSQSANRVKCQRFISQPNYWAWQTKEILCMIPNLRNKSVETAFSNGMSIYELLN